MILIFWALIHQLRKKARVILEQEQADRERLEEAIAQIERERTAMENIQAALGSGPWSMEFNECGELMPVSGPMCFEICWDMRAKRISQTGWIPGQTCCMKRIRIM